MTAILRATLLFVLSTAPLLANQQGVIVRDAGIYAQPSLGAKQVGTIEAGKQVAIFDRKGGWKEIFSESLDLVGWVRSYQVREGDYAPPVDGDAESDSRGFLSGLAAFSRKASRFFGGSGSNANSSTATIGVRGLSEAEIKAAKPDLREFARMQGYASDARRLADFRQQGQLSANEIAHIKPSTPNKARDKGATDK